MLQSLIHVQQDRKAEPRDPAGEPALTARSVVASLLLGMQPPQLSGQRLVRAAEVFGFSEGATRVALSRMVAGGELEVAAGLYTLSGSLLARQRRQEEGRFPVVRPWDGTWLVVVVGGSGRRPAAERASLRRQLSGLRLGEWREGVWARPDNLGNPDNPDNPDNPGRGPAAALAELSRLAPGATLLSGVRLQDATGAVDGGSTPEAGSAAASPSVSRELAASLWDLQAWAAAADGLRADMAASLPGLAAAAPGAIPRAFRLAASVVRQLRDDPLLPSELLPPGWSGDGLREAYDRYERAFQGALRPILLGTGAGAGSVGPWT